MRMGRIGLGMVLASMSAMAFGDALGQPHLQQIMPFRHEIWFKRMHIKRYFLILNYVMTVKLRMIGEQQKVVSAIHKVQAVRLLVLVLVNFEIRLVGQSLSMTHIKPVKPDLIQFVKVSLNGFKIRLNHVLTHLIHLSLSLCSDCMKKIWQGGYLMVVMARNGNI